MSEQPTPGAPTQQRTVRVFVSSTFRDMHAEREELVKRIFPQLRKLCEQRSVTWGEVDLRWGVTDEQKSEGKVLPICLAEIHNCRPYFIGLVGERYGWLPDEIPQELIERESWLAEHRERSVTELEILHGVLNNPQMANHAFFYFRTPSYIDSLPAEQQPVFREGPTPEEIERFGDEKAERRAEDRRQKLSALKQRIRASGFPVREDYPDPKLLGELVLRDLTEIINRLYPEGSRPDPLDREAAEHEAFAASRARAYIGRQEYFDCLHEHVQGSGPPLVVLGDSGSGKSALLANWALEFRQQHPSNLVLMHFIGASSYSADWTEMLRRIMGEFKRHFSIQQEIPDQPDALRVAFANWLHMAAAKGRLILILDALNQLEDRDGAPDLVWLPPEIPAGIRLIVSTLPGRPLDEMEKRGWPTLQVKPLELHERKQLVNEYLAQFTKALSEERVELISEAQQTANPLYLRALLDELRVFGIHEKLDERIAYYLNAQSVPELYEKILGRYEEDYDRDRGGLVEDTMKLLWAARKGLSEAELLDLLGSSGEKLPQAYWSPLYLAVETSLVSRSGLLTFFHAYLREAVQAKYLRVEEVQQATHLSLSDYFVTRELGKRKIDELPWQLAESQAWPRLYNLLADLSFCKAAWKSNRFDVEVFWTQVEANTSRRIIDAYKPVLEDAATREVHWSWVSQLLSNMGHPDEAMTLNRSLLEHYIDSRDPAGIVPLHNLAVLSIRQGDNVWSMEVLQALERNWRELVSDPAALTEWAENINQDTQSSKRSIGAQDLEETAEEMLGHSVFNQAKVLHARGNLKGSLELLEKAEQFFRRSGDLDGLVNCLGSRAQCVIDSKGDPRQALALLDEVDRLARQTGNVEMLAHKLAVQATILKEQGDVEQAMVLLSEAEKLFRQIGDGHGLGSTLGNQGKILATRGKLASAISRFDEAERLFRQVKDSNELVRVLDDKARVQARLMRWSESLVCIEEAHQLATQLGWSEMVQQSLSLLEFVRAKCVR